MELVQVTITCLEYFSNNNTKLPGIIHTHTQFILWNAAIKQPRNLASDPSTHSSGIWGKNFKNYFTEMYLLHNSLWDCHTEEKQV